MTVQKMIDILSLCPRHAEMGVVNSNENPEADYIGINRVINMAVHMNDDLDDEDRVVIVTE